MNPVTTPQLSQSPRENANFLSKVLFCWLIPLFKLGWKRDLELSDLYRVPHSDTSSNLGDHLSRVWEEEKVKKAKPSFLLALVKVFGLRFAFLGVFAFVEECVLKIVQPICLGLLIRYFGGEFRTEFGGYLGYIFATGLILGSWFYTFMHHPYFFETQHCGMRMRVACSSLIYRKALQLSHSSLSQTTIGQMVNLLSNDVNRFDVGIGLLHYLWVGPIQLTIVIYILWGYFGWPCLIGIALLVFFVPFQSQMGQLFGRLRSEVAVRTDKRVRIMNEVISAMRVIKMYVWEEPFASYVAEARKDEIHYIRLTAILRAINLSMYYISSKVIVFLTLLAFVLSGNFLTADTVFVTISLYNSVRLVMTFFFPNGIAQLAELVVSVRRLQDFLMMENRTNVPGPSVRSHKVPVALNNISAAWNPSSPTLYSISLQAQPGQLIAVIGPVGCGKGSLLQAILGELPITSGTLEVNGRISYTSQEPWIFNGSIRDNILFGSEFQTDRYQWVIKICALERDLTLLKFGDRTLVGDRGTSLSGGQKARINLARAVYAPSSDIYLLDDPLSAVDSEVARHLFEKCIVDGLKGKVRILVTHQLQFLKAADHIILLNGGKVQAEGSYGDLLKTGINFAQLLKDSHDQQVHEEQPVPPHLVNRRRNFKRSISMMEMGEMTTTIPASDFQEEEEEEPLIMRSYGIQHFERRKNRFLPRILKKQKKEESTPLLVQQNEEYRLTGDVTLSLYYKYIRAGSSICAIFLLALFNIVVQILFSGSDYWLQYWTKYEEKRTVNRTTQDNEDVLDPERKMDLIIYTIIISALFITSILRSAGFLNMCLTSSINLHKMLFSGILRAPMRFFEQNPVGRILNRFSKDIGIIDETLPPTLFDTMDIFLQFIGIIVVVCSINPYLLIPSCLLGIIFHYMRKFYLETARSLKRLEGVARSPVFSHLSTSLYGLVTIRAFKVEGQFAQQFDTYQDIHSSSWYLFLATARWLGIVVDWFCVCFVGIVVVSFWGMSGKDGAAVGLAVSSAMTLTGMFQWGVRQSAETENQMISVERVLDYAALEPEAEFESPIKPAKSWPLRGQIVFQKLSMKYDESLVLKAISCTINPKEKVGVVGRTGAGKSSLITTLFRIAEPCSGTIEIDGIDITKVGLKDLRSKISIIPQDPVLFVGTLRRNLDPFGDYDDDQLWEVLEEIQLGKWVKGDNKKGLDSEVSEGGSNFSVGQRQLICLGRAILRRNKILVLDEATANVDPETDTLIQTTIRSKFADCTVITIAHRLHTVMDSDRILVLDAGMVKEFETPYKLLLDTRSSLHSFVQ